MPSLHVESLSRDCLTGEDHLHAVTFPVRVEDQWAAGLRFGDRRVHALMHALCLFALAPISFRHRELRDHVAQLQSRNPNTRAFHQLDAALATFLEEVKLAA